MTMESSTEILRRLLDERGVEWRDTGKRLNVGNGVRIPIQTEYEQSCGGRWSTVTEALSGTLTVNNLTPEQAIAATLGDSDAVAFCKRVESATKEREPLTLFGVDYEARGECEIETTENWLLAEQYHRCKHCGAFFAVLDASGDIPPCVCPNCGKAVKR